MLILDSKSKVWENCLENLLLNDICLFSFVSFQI